MSSCVICLVLIPKRSHGGGRPMKLCGAKKCWRLYKRKLSGRTRRKETPALLEAAGRSGLGLWFCPVVHPAACFRSPSSLGPLSAHVENFIRRGLGKGGQPPRLLTNPSATELREFLREVRAAR